MKKPLALLPLCLFLSFLSSATCPANRQMSGQITDRVQSEYMVYLQPVGGAIMDSIRTKNGQFTFCLSSDALPYYVLTVKEVPRFIYYFLTDFSQKTSITITSLHKKTAQIQATARHERWIQGRKKVQQLFGQYLQKRRQIPNEAEWLPVQRKFDQQFQKIFLSSLEEDPILGVALIRSEINRLESINPSWETATALTEQLQGLPSNWAETPVVVALQKTLNHYIYAREGAQVQDFTLSGLYGGLVSSQDYRGQYLLLDFWGSWCKPCLEKNEKLRARYDELRAEGLVVLTVMLDYIRESFDEKHLEAARANDPAYPWPQGVLFQEEAEIIDYYRAYMIPRTILVDPDGNVIATDPATIEDIIKLLSSKRP